MDLPIVCLPGDGIGPDVVDAAERVLERVAERFGHHLELERHDFAGVAWDRTGTGFPDDTRAACAGARAILLGAVGDPRHDVLPAAERPERALLELRRMLDAYANLRPIKVIRVLDSSPFRPAAIEGADLLIVRELTGGIYYGEPRGIREEDGRRVGINTLRYDVREIERIARVAFEAAGRRRGLLLSVDKANVLESSQLWREVVGGLASNYPDVRLDHMYVDRAAMEIVRDPRQFDVILTGNMFGDILSDEASVLAGSLGLLPSASVGEGGGLYEPVHGSAPDIAGQGIANPLAAISSSAMMLDLSFGLKEEATAIESAVTACLRGDVLPRDLGGTAGTTEITDASWRLCSTHRDRRSSDRHRRAQRGENRAPVLLRMASRLGTPASAGTARRRRAARRTSLATMARANAPGVATNRPRPCGPLCRLKPAFQAVPANLGLSVPAALSCPAGCTGGPT